MDNTRLYQLAEELAGEFMGEFQEINHYLFEHPELEFVLLQINYLDWEDEGIESRKCLEVARKYEKPVIRVYCHFFPPCEGSYFISGIRFFASLRMTAGKAVMTAEIP